MDDDEGYRIAAVLDGSAGALLFDATRAALDRAGLVARYDLLGLSGAAPSAHDVSGRVRGEIDFPPARELEFDESDREIVLSADATIIAGTSLAAEAGRDTAGGRDAREAQGALGARGIDPAAVTGRLGGVRWLMRALDVAIRFQPCRSFAGNPWNQSDAMNLIVLGDGGLGEATDASRSDLVNAAWGFAQRHDASRITLALGTDLSPAERDLLVPLAQRLARQNPQIGFATVSLGIREPVELLLATPASHVVIAPGADGERMFDVAQSLGGGPAFTASARFGQAVALIEIGGGAAAESPAAGVPSMSPVASVLAAKVICEWVGVTGRGARIDRALAASIAEGALGTLSGDPARDRAAMAEITRDILRRL
jgi:hypothetical protein